MSTPAQTWSERCNGLSEYVRKLPLEDLLAPEKSGHLETLVDGVLCLTLPGKSPEILTAEVLSRVFLEARLRAAMLENGMQQALDMISELKAREGQPLDPSACPCPECTAERAMGYANETRH